LEELRHHGQWWVCGRWLAYDASEEFVNEYPSSALAHYLEATASDVTTAVADAKLFGRGIKEASRTELLGIRCIGQQISLNDVKINFMWLGPQTPLWTPQEQLRAWPTDLKPCCPQHYAEWYEDYCQREDASREAQHKAMVRDAAAAPPTPPPRGRMTQGVKRALEAVAELSEEDSSIFLLSWARTRQTFMPRSVRECLFCQRELSGEQTFVEQIQVRYACHCVACEEAVGLVEDSGHVRGMPAWDDGLFHFNIHRDAQHARQ